MRVLGLETSCDDTGAAVYDSERGLLAHRLYSQSAQHAEYGGVVPELASRDHIRMALPLIRRVLAEAANAPTMARAPTDGQDARRPGKSRSNPDPIVETATRPSLACGPRLDPIVETATRPSLACGPRLDPIVETGRGFIDGIAYTAGPGLAGALLVGAALGRSLAHALGIPAVAIHHMEGHLLSPMLEPEPPRFPFLALLVSGGHTLLANVRGLGAYTILGESLDDAVGEAFDKVAKLLGLGYPGGPAIEQTAHTGRPGRYRFPRPMTDRPGFDFSFSGLKTAVSQSVPTAPDAQTIADIALAFQEAAVETLTIKCERALEQTGHRELVVAGGVSANRLLRERLRHMTRARGARVFYPRFEFCTDNGAMIAFAGFLRLCSGQTEALAFGARPRWHIDELPSVKRSTD